MSKNLRWKKDQGSPTLKLAGQSHQRWVLWDGERVYATLYPTRLHGGALGWYWVAGRDSRMKYKTTIDAPHPVSAKAKAQAMAYVKNNI